MLICIRKVRSSFIINNNNKHRQFKTSLALQNTSLKGHMSNARFKYLFYHHHHQQLDENPIIIIINNIRISIRISNNINIILLIKIKLRIYFQLRQFSSCMCIANNYFLIKKKKTFFNRICNVLL